MNLITKIFNKKQPSKAAPEKKANPTQEKLTSRLIAEKLKPDLEAFYKCSVQKTVEDFQIQQVNIEGAIVNVAMDSIEAQDLKGLQSIYDPNIMGQEIIFTHFAKQSFIGFNNCAILAQDWLINKAICLPCKDAIAVDYDVTLNETDMGTDDKDVIAELIKLSKEVDKFKINEVCQTFAQNKRKYGQALCVPLIEEVDYSLPFNIDAIRPKSYKGMACIEPMWVAPVLDMDATTNPVSKRFYKPTWFRLPNGKLIHYTWFIFNVYAEVADILKPTYYFGGLSLPQLLYEQVYAADKTAKEAPMLAQSKRLNYLEGNLNAFIADGEKFSNTLNIMTWLRNNWGWLFIKKDQKIGQLDTTLTDFDAVTMLGYQIVAAISEVPSVKLLETSPKGWQSSGGFESDSYKQLQKGIQNIDYVPILDLHYRLLAKSEFDIDKNYSCVFSEIDTPTEKERAEIREINSRTDANYINAGVVAPDEVRTVLREDVNSGYNALSEEIETSEPDPFDDIDPKGGNSNEPDPFSLDEFKESDHPRDNDGKFSSGNSSSEKPKETTKSNITSEFLGNEIKDVKGQNAINVLLKEQNGYVKAAFSREDTGPIDLIWGDKNRGLCHIIQRRKEQGIDVDNFLSNLSDVIEKGKLVRTNNKGRYEIFHEGKMAVIEPEITNGQLTFLLTAFKRRKT